MNSPQFFFWFFVLIIFHAYLGYALLVYVLLKLKGSKKEALEPFFPDVAFIVPCYNEASIIADKVKNTLALKYPQEKIKLYFITDGSDDGTDKEVSKFETVTLLHLPERSGKAAAINRAMQHIHSEIVCFSDANTHLPEDALINMMKHYALANVGAVSGEKRVFKKDKDNASASGEGFYWKYESTLKKLDAAYYSLVGAAGELISFRPALFTPLEEDSILDDFMISMRIAAKGFKVVYEPDAFAMETASASVKEELKRKVRICAGGWQSMKRLFFLISPFKNFKLFYLYYSHRVLRWSLVPLLLVLLIPLNIALLGTGIVYTLFFCGQALFYLAAFLGHILANKNIRFKPLFIPYYFYIMNYAVFAGFLKFMKGKQSAAWDRAKRASAEIAP